MSQVNSNSRAGIKKVYGPVTVDGINIQPSLNEKRDNAQLRQTVTSIYPGVRNSNSLSDALFPAEAFAAQAQEYTEERVTWIPVPKGTTVEQVVAALKDCPNPRIIRILDLRPILSDEQRVAMERGLSKTKEGNPLTISDYAMKQAVRNPETNEVILYKGHPQYRVTAFMREAVEDVDLREETLASVEPPVHMGAEPEKIVLENTKF